MWRKSAAALESATADRKALRACAQAAIGIDRRYRQCYAEGSNAFAKIVSPSLWNASSHSGAPCSGEVAQFT